MTSTSVLSAPALLETDQYEWLTPSSQAAVRLTLEEGEPLLKSDEVLALQLKRVLGIAGIARGEWWAQSFRETRDLFEKLEVTLRTLAPTIETSVEAVVLGAHIHALCETLHRFDLGRHMALNGHHTADEYLPTEGYFHQLSKEVQGLSERILEQLPAGESFSSLRALIRELSHLPELIDQQGHLTFELRHDIPLKSGDTFVMPGYGTVLVVDRRDDGMLNCISYSYSEPPFEQVLLHEDDVYASTPKVSRGARNELSLAEGPSSARQPILVRSHVIPSPFDEARREYVFGECISLPITGPGGRVQPHRMVLWHLKDGSARLEDFIESELRTFDRRSSEGDGAKSVLSKSRFEALSAIAQSPRDLPKQRDREARELQALCKAVLQADLPIALHIMGGEHVGREYEGFDALCAAMVQVTRTGLPTEDPQHLRAHMCVPVLLVLEGEEEVSLGSKLFELREKGWEVIVVRNKYASNDYFIDWAIEDNHARARVDRFTVIEGTSPQLPDRVTKKLLAIGKRGRAALDVEIGCKMGNSELRANISPELTSKLSLALDHLAEASPSRPITQRPRDLLALRAIVHHPESLTSDGDGSELHTLTRTLNSPVGRTDIPTSWSRRQLVELSGTLANSRLSPSHPAVILRGITCSDLSPRALEILLKKGAHFIRITDESAAIRGVILSLPPDATDVVVPGFSRAVHREGASGYIYWIRLDPTLSGEVRAPYAKLVNRMVFDQFQDGATFICGLVLERNSQSLRAAVGNCGFSVLPIQTRIGGEAAVGVGFDLAGWDEIEPLALPQRNPRSVLDQSIDLFARGVASSTLDEATLTELRLRVTTTAGFLARQRAFRCSCQDLLAVAHREVAWVEIDSAAEKAEAALKELSQWLTPSQVSDLEGTIELMTIDDRREQALRSFHALILEVVPESEREISRLYAVLTEKAQVHLGLTLEPLSSYIPMRPTKERSTTIPLPPATDPHVAFARSGALSQPVQQHLYFWKIRLRDRMMATGGDHPPRGIGDRFFLQWVNGQLQQHGAFLWPTEVDSNWNGHQLTPLEQQHLEEFTAIIRWANEAARLGHFDYKFGKQVWLLLQPYFGEAKNA